MGNHDHEHLTSGLARISQRLRDERPQASELELDRIKLEVQSRVRRRGRRKEPLMRSRLVITTMLMVGILMSTAGAGLAVSGISGDGDAGTAQYGTTPPDRVLGRTDTPDGDVAGVQDEGGVGGVQDEGPPTAGDVQPSRQLSAGDDESLPFTGYAAIPLLLVGMTLLAVGLVTRRRVQQGT